MRFSTQSLLERHVNNHFKSKLSGANVANGATGFGNGGVNRKSVDNASASSSSHHYTPPPSAVKMIKKAGRRLKYRKTIFSARIFDLFDLGVMAQVRERLSHIQEAGRGDLELSGNGEEVTLVGEIAARRTDADGKVLVLQRWKPDNM
jgi:zinc finger protein AEBP2